MSGAPVDVVAPPAAQASDAHIIQGGERLGPRRPKFRRYLSETSLLTARALRTLARVPDRVSEVVVQPIMFTLLFVYVFGSAIHVPGVRYQDYLLPGIVGQALAFGVIAAGVSAATDFSSDVVDRFRSLPVTRLSVISAQVFGQALEQGIGLVIVAVVGLVLGWRPHLTAIEGVELGLLLVLGLLAFNSLGILLGQIFKRPDSVQGFGFAVIFPFAFISGTYVPIEGMALIPRTFAEWNPVSAFVAGVREICQGIESHGSWPLEHPIPAMIMYSVVIMAVCIPLALRRFGTAAA